MATIGMKPALLLGLVVTTLVIAAAQPPEDKKNQGAVTIYNPAGLVLDIMNDYQSIRVTTDTATVELTQEEQPLQISILGGQIEIIVRIDDLIELIPDPADPSNVQALKVLVNGEEAQPQVLPVGVLKPDVRP